MPKGKQGKHPHDNPEHPCFNKPSQDSGLGGKKKGLPSHSKAMVVIQQIPLSPTLVKKGQEKKRSSPGKQKKAFKSQLKKIRQRLCSKKTRYGRGQTLLTPNQWTLKKTFSVEIFVPQFDQKQEEEIMMPELRRSKSDVMAWQVESMKFSGYANGGLCTYNEKCQQKPDLSQGGYTCEFNTNKKKSWRQRSRNEVAQNESRPNDEINPDHQEQNLQPDLQHALPEYKVEQQVQSVLINLTEPGLSNEEEAVPTTQEQGLRVEYVDESASL